MRRGRIKVKVMRRKNQRRPEDPTPEWTRPVYRDQAISEYSREPGKVVVGSGISYMRCR